jgi:predicted nucleotidyltransferase
MMTIILESKRQAIAQACRRHGVRRLDAFGSALRDDFRPDASDLDLLVEFGQMEPYDRVDAYFGLLGELRTLLGLKIDLVMVGAIRNPYIASDIERTKQVLYAA